jgi:hypothetical protein
MHLPGRHKSIDVQVVNEGNIYLFELLTDSAKEWVHANVEDPQFWGKYSLIVAHQLVGEVVYGMLEDGLTIH